MAGTMVLHLGGLSVGTFFLCLAILYLAAAVGWDIKQLISPLYRDPVDEGMTLVPIWIGYIVYDLFAFFALSTLFWQFIWAALIIIMLLNIVRVLQPWMERRKLNGVR